MAVYDSLGVPVLSFHNPAATILYPEGLYSYPIGNTRGRDLTENLGTRKDKHLDVLLLASGDVRNILFTVLGLSLRKPDDRPKSVSFHLNDYDPSIVARNAVILEIAKTINPDVQEDIDFLWNVWCNMALSTAHFERLQAVLTSLIERNFDDSEKFLKFQASSVLQECQGIWKDWKELRDLDVNSVKEERKNLIRKRINMLDDLCHALISEIMMAPFDVSDIIDKSSPFYREIEHWFQEGSTNDEQDFVNPTLIRPFVHKWKVHYSSCAFEGYLPLNRKDLIRCGSFTDCCKENLRLMVKWLQRFENAMSLEVTLWSGDGLLLCTSGLPQDLKFDVIDTSNVSDHIGLLNVLICCSPRLKRPLESQMFTSSMLWHTDCKNMMEYYSKCVGVNTYLLPTILGLKLAVDFDLGNRKLPDRVMTTTEEVFCWVKTEEIRTIIKLEKDSDVVHAIVMLAERCFDLLGQWKGQVFGTNLSSPLTFLRILHQLHPLIEGGAPRILDLIQSKLPNHFEEKFGLSWNLIKGSIGSKRETIVEVNVQVDISIASWYDGTPIPMIVFNNQAELFQEVAQFITGVIPTVNNTSRVVYNSLRYDESKHVVTFHLLEKDWNKLKDESWLKVFSNMLTPIVCSDEPVFLGHEGVVSNVRRVDPVETFGLFSVQTFHVRPKKETSGALEVIKVEESDYSYSAELAILDPNRCKAKMSVKFYPERCASKVNVIFGDKEQLTLHFSCSVEANSSTFQISRKQGKIVCQMPKREYGTVGESVIQNPGPVPFHSLERWDTGLLDTVSISGKMFRTMLDLLLKKEGKSGDAFFNLRESIQLILQKHLKEPGILTSHCVEDKVLISGPYLTPDDIMQKKGFVIKVENIFRWNYLPVIKVIFYDCKRFGDIMKKNPTGSESQRLIRSFFQKTMFNSVHRIMAYEKEIVLFRKMLYTNAARVSQDGDADSVWKASFITLLFPREEPIDIVAETMRTFGDNKHLFEGGDQSAAFKDVLPAFLAAPGCHFCRKTTGDLKKCMGCKNVSYCSKDCQTRDWKLNHKSVCRKN